MRNVLVLCALTLFIGGFGMALTTNYESPLPVTEDAQAYGYLSLACAGAALRANCDSADDDIHRVGVQTGASGFWDWYSYAVQADNTVRIVFRLQYPGGSIRRFCAWAHRNTDSYVPDDATAFAGNATWCESHSMKAWP